MSDKTEAKKQEEQEPQKPWLFRKLHLIKEATTDKKRKKHFEELFAGVNQRNIPLKDEESVEYVKKMERLGKDGKRILNMESIYFPLSFLRQSGRHAIPFLWDAWVSARVQKEQLDLTWLDLLVLDWLSRLKNSQVIALQQKNPNDFFGLVTLAEKFYNNNATHLYLIGSILMKVEEEGSYSTEFLASRGRDFIAQSQALRLKKELKFEETKNELARLKKDTEKGIAEAKENENRMTRNFVQIIGIFAAIIAFVVTIVPTAVRLGGASVPIALAGLAIVTAGIIVLLAMIFGREGQKKTGLIVGISIAGFLFLAWLAGTIWLAIYYPEILTTVLH